VGLLKRFINKHELEDWEHCWVIQQNVNQNTSGPPGILFWGYNYTGFLGLMEHSTTQLQEQNEKKKKLKQHL
jgi:hypothetical protein